MKLLPSVSVRRLRTLPPGTGFTLAVCGCLVGLEVLGRLVASDLQDVLGVFALIGLGLTVALRHRREPLPWVRGLAAVVGYFVLVAAVAWAVPPVVVVGLCLGWRSGRWRSGCSRGRTRPRSCGGPGPTGRCTPSRSTG